MLEFMQNYSFLILYCFTNLYLFFSYLRIADYKRLELRGILALLFFGFPLALIVGSIMIKSFWRDNE